MTARPAEHVTAAPQDLDAEAAVLSAVILDSAHTLELVQDVVRPNDFYSLPNRLIAEAVWSLRAERGAIDEVTIAKRLRDDDNLQAVGGTPYLAQIIGATPAVSHADEHAQIVRDKARARKLISGAQVILAEAKTGGELPGLLRRLRELAADLERSGFARETPTTDEPLRGLRYLGPVALLGRDAIQALAAEPVVYLWRDIVVAGTIVLIAGPPAEGKTTLLFLILAARMHVGAPLSLLGREIQPAPAGQYIVLIEGEHSDASTARKLVKSMALLGADQAGLDRVIVVARKAVRLHSPEWLDVGRLVAAGLVSDIALDTIARVAPADANDEREQVALFDEVARTIELAPKGLPKPTAWCIAHTRKNGNGASSDLADVSGSAQRTGQADSVLMIKGEKVDGRTVSTTVTFSKLREDPDEYPMQTTFSIEADRFGGEPVLRMVNAPKQDDRPIEQRIVDHLRIHGPSTKSALRGALKRNAATVDAGITTLFEARAIEAVEVTVRGNPTKAFSLRNHPGLHPGLGVSKD